MRIVVADTGPLHYLVLTDVIELLPRLFGTVLTPAVVQAELSHPRTPDLIRDWMAARPPWLDVAPTPPLDTLPLPALGDGERAALALAHSVGAGLVLMDDRAGVAAGRGGGLTVMGTLGVLDLAAGRGMIDLRSALARLTATNFRIAPELIDALVAKHQSER